MQNQIFNQQQTYFIPKSIQNISIQANLQKRFIFEPSIQQEQSLVLKIFFNNLQYSNLKHIFLNWIKNDLKQNSQTIQNNNTLNLFNNNINLQQRSIILGKLITLHRKLKLKNIVLFHSVKVLDNYLLKESYQQQIKYHLLPINCLIISHKYFNMRRIRISKWLQLLEIQQKQYSINQIIQNQGKILQKLDFNIQFQISFEIAYLLSSTLKLSQKTHMFMRYLLQLSFFLQPSQYNEKRKSFLVGVSCVHLSCFFLQPQLWNNDYLQLFRISIEEMQQFCGQLFNMLMRAKEDLYLKVVYNKFKKKAYKNVADITFEKFQGSQEQSKQKISIGTPETCCDQDVNDISMQSFSQESQYFYSFLKDNNSNIEENWQKRLIEQNLQR